MTHRVTVGIVGAGVVLLTAATSWAADGIRDPKSWCAAVTDKLAIGDTHGVAQMVDEGSRGKADMSGFEASFEYVMAKIRGSGSVNAKSFLAEKDYQGAFRNEWFMIVLDRAPYFVRCSFINYDGSWQFSNLLLKPSPEDAGL